MQITIKSVAKHEQQQKEIKSKIMTEHKFYVFLDNGQKALVQTLSDKCAKMVVPDATLEVDEKEYPIGSGNKYYYINAKAMTGATGNYSGGYNKKQQFENLDRFNPDEYLALCDRLWEKAKNFTPNNTDHAVHIFDRMLSCYGPMGKKG